MNHQITEIHQVLNNCNSCVWHVITSLGRLQEYNDYNDVTMAYDDGTQVRHTRSSLHQPVQLCNFPTFVRPHNNCKLTSYSNCEVRSYNNRKERPYNKCKARPYNNDLTFKM